MNEQSVDAAESWLANVLGSDIAARAVLGVVIVLLTLWLAHVLVRIVHRAIAYSDEELAQASFYEKIVRGGIYIVGACAFCDAVLGINMSALIAALGVGGIAISLGFQDTLSNLIGGATITMTRLFRPGDNIQVGSDSGVVEDIGWRHTTIRNRVGEVIMIPNSVISKTSVRILAPLEKVAVWFVVRNNQDLDEFSEKVSTLVRDAVSKVVPVEGEPTVIFTEISEYGARGKVVVMIADGSLVNEATSAAARAISPLTSELFDGEPA